jgi:hypothetical protein
MESLSGIKAINSFVELPRRFQFERRMRPTHSRDRRKALAEEGMTLKWARSRWQSTPQFLLLFSLALLLMPGPAVWYCLTTGPNSFSNDAPR